MNIFRYYNQNRKTIWLVIIAIIILIIAIQALNNIIKNQNENKSNINPINEKAYENNLNINVLISEERVKEDEELIIDQFLRYCNSGKIQEAYNLLTDECKNELFPNIEIFKQNYYNINFSTTKLYSKEEFLDNTYKVKIYEDILATGTVNNNVIEDYYTIKKDKGNVKLNIGNYIDNKNINKTNTSDNLQVKVVKKQIYKEYEKYEIQITNLTYNTILMDTKEDTKTMYLVGNNGVKYYSLSHEIIKDDLLIKSKETVTISIKYNKEYNSNREIDHIVFSDVILDYDLYQTNKNNNKKHDDRKKIEIYI